MCISITCGFRSYKHNNITVVNLSSVGDGVGSNSAAWYFYTPPGDGTIDVSACLRGSDTNLYILGDCVGPTIVNNDNSCPFAPDGSGNDLASELNGVIVTGGTTYYIEWLTDGMLDRLIGL